MVNANFWREKAACDLTLLSHMAHTLWYQCNRKRVKKMMKPPEKYEAGFLCGQNWKCHLKKCILWVGYICDLDHDFAYLTWWSGEPWESKIMSKTTRWELPFVPSLFLIALRFHLIVKFIGCSFHFEVPNIYKVIKVDRTTFRMFRISIKIFVGFYLYKQLESP